MGQKKVIEKTEKEVLDEEKKLKEASLKTSDAAVKSKKKLEMGKVYISVGYNNTVLTATDKNGNVLAWTSAGSIGFSGPKKATPFAASKMVAAVSEKMKKLGFSDIEVFIKGVGSSRDASLKALAGAGFNITAVKDVTPLPHNGPKPPKIRRV